MKKKLFSILLALGLIISLIPASALAADTTSGDIEFWDIRNESNVSVEELNVTVDGVPMSVTRYTGHYYDENEENQIVFGISESAPALQGLRDDLQINIYVPEGADEDSAVLFILQNSSWAQNGFPTDTVVDGYAYVTSNEGIVVPTIAARSADFDCRAANALARNMIIVSYGARSRGQVSAVECLSTDEDAVELESTGIYYKPGTDYVCHSPATIADTKAAIRYVKYNLELGTVPGDPEKIIAVGHSGGGGLATIIGASGNSSDYDPYLVNAAPSTDDVFAVLASAPITDLPMADFAYEFTYGEYRSEGKYAPTEDLVGNTNGYLSYLEPDEELMALSAQLSEDYEDYIMSMFGLTADEFRAEMVELLKDSVQHEIDIDPSFEYEDTTYVTPETDDRGWFELDENGDVAAFDMDTYLVWMLNNVNLGDTIYNGNEAKGVIAFMGMGIDGAYTRNENNLWGTTDQRYSIAYSYLWDRVTDPAAIGVDQYNSFDEFWEAEGENVAMQMKMASPMAYLTGSENMWYLEGLDDSGDDTDVTPNWFVRHGLCDCDTSVAMLAQLKLAVEENATGDVNFYFGWERDHNAGMHYMPEFFAWVDEIAGTSVQTTAGTFTDVAASAYYCDAVNWAVANGITTGATNTTFALETGCTRAQVVTFLYRAAGSPAAEGENPFTDVAADAYYCDAVLWAVANGITTGATETTFEPDAVCTRGQIVTFLYRAADAYAEAAESFADVSADAYYAPAVAWAVAGGITNGTSDTTFSPDSPCTRGQVVTFLYRNA